MQLAYSDLLVGLGKVPRQAFGLLLLCPLPAPTALEPSDQSF